MSTLINDLDIIATRDVVSSTIKTATELNIFQTIGNGVSVTEVIVTTDSTGLAGGTALVLKADGITFFQTAISGLGSKAVKDIKNASVTGSKVNVPAGTKYITISSTVADCTGAGVATVVLMGKKLDTDSRITAI